MTSPTTPAEEPVAPELARALRRAVLDFVQQERRRVFAATLHVGRPGGGSVTFGEPDLARWDAGRRDPGLDAALRTEVVAALLTRVGTEPVPLAWLTRSGALAPHDADARWLAPAIAAFGEAGIPLTMVVVTRQGWLDPRSGATRRWRRLRQR